LKGVAQTGCAFYFFRMHAESWLEVSLVVDGEMAEAVSDVLTRYVSGGVVIESTQITSDLNGEGRVSGPLRVCGYLLVDEHLDEKKQSLSEALWHLGQIRPLPPVIFEPVADLDWTEIWKQHFHPIPIGRRLLISPTWIDIEAGNRLAVKMDPGMAFGTGTHPTTQLCLEILEDLLDEQRTGEQVEDKSPLRMIDLGCGSGILSIAAVKLGVSYVLGLDLDPEVVEVARRNCIINEVGDRIELHTGSLFEIQVGEFPILSAPLVTVNILASVIVRLLETGLSELVTPGGKLILSGILAEQAEEVEASVLKSGLRLTESRQSGDWLALLVEPVSRL
jgi:ribosomal protein L11 methyltransferase